MQPKSLAGFLLTAALLSLTAAISIADDNDKPLAQQRGLQNYTGGNSRTLVIVKAPFAKVTDALMQGNPTKVIVQDPLSKPAQVKPKSYFVLQLKGHDWTAILSLTKQAIESQKLALQLAGFLKTKAVFYSFSSNETTHYRLYDGPKEIESLDSMDPEIARQMLAADVPMDATTRKMYQDVKAAGGVLLHSSARKLIEPEKISGDAFVNRALKEEDALVPDTSSVEFIENAKVPIVSCPFTAKELAGSAFVTGANAPATQAGH